MRLLAGQKFVRCLTAADVHKLSVNTPLKSSVSSAAKSRKCAASLTLENDIKHPHWLKFVLVGVNEKGTYFSHLFTSRQTSGRPFDDIGKISKRVAPPSRYSCTVCCCRAEAAGQV